MVQEEIKEYLNNLFRGSVLNFVGEVVKRGVSYIYQIFIVRFLGTNIFGIYTISHSIVNIVLNFSQMGLDKGGTRYIAIFKKKGNYKLIKKIFTFLLIFSFLSGIIWSIIIFLSAPFLSTIYKKNELKNALLYFSLSLPFYASFFIVSSSSKGLNEMKYYVMSECFLRQFLQIFFFLLLIYLIGKQISSSILPWFFSSFFSLFFFFFLLKEEFKKSGEDEKFKYSEIVIYSFPVMFNSIFYFIFIWMDIILLGFFRPSKEVGIYNATARTAEIANIFLFSLNEVFSPFISQLSYRKDNVSLGIMYKTVIRWSLYLTFPLFIFFIFSGKDFLEFVFGKEFSIGYIPLVILLSGIMCQILIGEVALTLIMSGYQKEWAITTFFGVIISLVLGIILIPRFGIVGASLSTFLSLLILRIVGLLEVKKFLKLKTHDFETFKPLFQALLCFIIMNFLSFVFIKNIKYIFLRLSFVFLISYFLYFVLFYFIKPPKEDIFIIKDLKKAFLK